MTKLILVIFQQTVKGSKEKKKENVSVIEVPEVQGDQDVEKKSIKIRIHTIENIQVSINNKSASY